MDRVGGLSKCDVQTGWVEHITDSVSSCYHFSGIVLAPWLEAQENCQKRGGDLVVISSDDENNIVYGMAGGEAFKTWIGLSNYDQLDNSLQWVTSESNYQSRRSYKNWLGKAPEKQPSEVTCAYLGKGEAGVDQGKWHSDNKCGEEQHFVCEAKPMGSCPIGWVLFEGNCYFVNSVRKVSWNIAKDSCEAVGASLLKIENENQQHFLKHHFYPSEEGPDSDLWIGFSDEESDGIFKWTDGSSASSGFENFGDNQPVNTVGTWDCGSIYTGNPDLKWETMSCFRDQGFICQIRSGRELDESSGSNYHGCKSGWKAFKDPKSGNVECFKFSTEDADWETAEKTCQNFGENSHLASIHSPEEMAYFSKSSGKELWVGGKRAAGGQDFSWSDDTPLDIAIQWGENEPNEDNSRDRCTLIENDIDHEIRADLCEYSRAFVCKDEQESCFQPMGLEDSTIKDSQESCSSHKDKNHGCSSARLNGENSWTPEPSYNYAEDSHGKTFLEIDLLPKSASRESGFRIHGIATQGDEKLNSWVTKYKVAYNSKSLSTSDDDWKIIENFEGGEKIFIGNENAAEIVTNLLTSSASITAKRVRVYPLENGYSNPESKHYYSMRVEIYGCMSDGSEMPSSDSDETCSAVALTERLECGFEGITKSECVSRGCCFDNTKGTPSCFYHKGDHDSHCYPGWTYYSDGDTFGHCYLFAENIKRSYQGNIEFCAAERTLPLYVQSASEMDWIKKEISGKIGTDLYWTGGNKMDERAGWTWYSSPSFPFINWDASEPQNLIGDTIALRASTGKWKVLPEADQLGVACKHPTTGSMETGCGKNCFKKIVCEGQTQRLTCGPITSYSINILNAYYGRKQAGPCEHPQIDDCRKTVEVTSDLKQACNGRHECEIKASNELGGDPCPNVYKYLEVHFECVEHSCFEPLLESSGNFGSELTGSTGDATLAIKSSSGWLANTDDSEPWIQFDPAQMYRLWAISTWGIGAGDDGKWVEKFYIEYQSSMYTQKDDINWVKYTHNYQTVMFEGNNDPFAEKHNNLEYPLSYRLVRIRPTEWHSDQLGMRIEFFGCQSDDIISCGTPAEHFMLENTVDDTAVSKICPAQCREAMSFGYEVYGTGQYAGDSQVCMAAIHAGVIQDHDGGPITFLKKPGSEDPDFFRSSYQNRVESFGHSKGFPFSFVFSDALFNCPEGAQEFGDFCYYFYATTLTWLDADLECRETHGGHLVSIHKINEVGFLEANVAQNAQFGTRTWIGFRDSGSNGEFDWVDDSLRQITYWAPGEPSNPIGGEKSCVEMDHDARWFTADCAKENSFVCKFERSHNPITDNGPPEGCPEGFEAFEDKCYKFVSDVYATQGDAQKDCEDLDSTLAIIPDSETNAFVFSRISQLGFWEFWFGLENAENRGSKEDIWMWVDGSQVTWTNWFMTYPHPGHGFCGFFAGSDASLGLWMQGDCKKSKKHYVCQKQRTGFDPKPKPTHPPHPDGCPGTTKDGWKINPSDPTSVFCYQIVSKEFDASFIEVNWKSAREQCRSKGGDLVSIGSLAENDAIEKLLIEELPDEEDRQFWIGLSDTREGWQWSDDSPMVFLNWAFQPPEWDLNSHSAAVMKFQHGKNGTSALWKQILELEERDFICKIRKGTILPTPSPVPPKISPDESCKSQNTYLENGNWFKIDQECHFISTEKLSFHSALEKCRSADNFDLVSIHSSSKNNEIYGAIRGVESSISRFLIGLKELSSSDGGYEWTDSTPLDFTSWAAGQPNDQNGGQKCVLIDKLRNGQWEDVNCGLSEGYICGPAKSTPQPPAENLFCEPGWMRNGDACFQLGEGKHNWTSAEKSCKQLGANLASVHSQYENALIYSLTGALTDDLWIGFHDLSRLDSWIWTDNSAVTYANWAHGEPNHGGDDVSSTEDCTVIRHRDGLWNDLNCDATKNFVCSKLVSEQTETSDNSGCPDGFQKMISNNGEINCFMIDMKPKSYHEAKSSCSGRADNAELASLLNAEESNFIFSLQKSETVWLGLEWDKSSQEYKWIDQWPVHYSKWGDGYPRTELQKNCVSQTENLEVNDFEWTEESCQKPMASVCSVRASKPPAKPIDVEGECPYNSGNSIKYTTKCIWEVSTARSWLDAEAFCSTESRKYGSNLPGFLVSLHSIHDVDFLLSKIKAGDSWIGLTVDRVGGWGWSDKTALQFLNWRKGEPNGDNENCVHMYSSDGTWNDLSCSTEKTFLCEAPVIQGFDENNEGIPAKPIYPDGEFHPTEPTKSKSSSNAGVIVGAMFGVIVGVAIIGTVVYKFDFYRVFSDTKTGVLNVLHRGSTSSHDEELGVYNRNYT